jgi:hypothetical protein
MSSTNRPLAFYASRAQQELVATLEERLQLSRSALILRALTELAKREGVALPDGMASGGPARRRPQVRQIADPPGPIGGR